MFKLAKAQELLRRLHEKQAGLGVPLAVGLGLAAGVHGTKKALTKSQEYKAGFTPGFNPHGSHE